MRWWTDWKLYRSLPYGGDDVLSQPYFVVQVMNTCAETEAEVEAAKEAKAKREHDKWKRDIMRNNRRGR